MLETMANRRDELNERDKKIAQMLREEGDIPVVEHFLRVARRMSAKAKKAKHGKKNYYEAGGIRRGQDDTEGSESVGASPIKSKSYLF